MKILIATGGSDYSFMAVRKACELVIRPETTEIKIISVYKELAQISPEPLELSQDGIDQLENLGRMQATEAALYAEKTIRDHFEGTTIKCTMTAVKGQPQHKIIEVAEKWGADLIVVGSFGHSFVSRLLLGSVSDAIVRRAKCSVLVVRGDLEKK